jgi:hypothetical protein
MIQIDTSNKIILDGRPTGLAVTQNGRGTIVYTPESQISGTRYQEHTMPHARYSLAHDNPRPAHASPEVADKYPPSAGRAQFEADIRALLNDKL